MIEEKYTEIERSNRILFEKMANILRRGESDVSPPPFSRSVVHEKERRQYNLSLPRIN